MSDNGGYQTLDDASQLAESIARKPVHGVDGALDEWCAPRVTGVFDRNCVVHVDWRTPGIIELCRSSAVRSPPWTSGSRSLSPHVSSASTARPWPTSSTTDSSRASASTPYVPCPRAAK